MNELTVDEILNKIETRITLDLDEVSRKIEGDIHASSSAASRLPERVKNLTDRMVKVQQGIDEVLLVQRHLISKFEAAMAYQQHQATAAPTNFQNNGSENT